MVNKATKNVRSNSDKIAVVYKTHNWFVLLRGCSYGGELAQLGGLARLVEISPSLRNSYKNIMCSYEK